MMSNNAISMENWTHAWSTFENTSTSRGNATLRTRPAFADTEPRPRLVMSEKKFHGSSPHSNQSAKLSRPLGSPTGGVESNKRTEHEAVDEDLRQRIEHRPGPAEE